jgi:hypothetical protein
MSMICVRIHGVAALAGACALAGCATLQDTPAKEAVVAAAAAVSPQAIANAQRLDDLKSLEETRDHRSPEEAHLSFLRSPMSLKATSGRCRARMDCGGSCVTSAIRRSWGGSEVGWSLRRRDYGPFLFISFHL